MAVVCATYRRAELLAGLVAALEAQDLGPERFEVVLVDDGSDDATWDVLTALASSSPLRLQPVRLDANAGPATARDTGVGATGAPLLAFTDDDCLPAPSWLSSIVAAFEADPGIDVVQGRTEPVPSEREGMRPWDHTLWLTEPTPWFETCNVAYRRTAYERVGGFDRHDPVLNPGGGRHFGEDVDLGARVLATGGRRAFVDGALVHHRVLPGDWRSWLRGKRRLVDFPDLARRSAVVRDSTVGGVFLNDQTALVDLGLAGLAVAVAGRRWWPLLAAVPWARRRWRDAMKTSGGDRSAAIGIAAGLAVGDAVAAGSLLQGSVRHRTLLL